MTGCTFSRVFFLGTAQSAHTYIRCEPPSGYRKHIGNAVEDPTCTIFLSLPSPGMYHTECPAPHFSFTHELMSAGLYRTFKTRNGTPSVDSRSQTHVAFTCYPPERAAAYPSFRTLLLPMLPISCTTRRVASTKRLAQQVETQPHPEYGFYHVYQYLGSIGT